MESKEAEASLAGYSRKVTPLAFIHKRVRPLDGWMVVANPYHLSELILWVSELKLWVYELLPIYSGCLSLYLGCIVYCALWQVERNITDPYYVLSAVARAGLHMSFSLPVHNM